MKSIVVAFLLTVIVTASALALSEFAEEEWEEFKALHFKKYSDSEDSMRMKIYFENRHIIAKHNIKTHGFTLGMNKYGDMLSHEFSAIMNGYRAELRNETFHSLEAGTFITPKHVTVPDSFDWRTSGAVTPVKDQGQCGSCWAFSSTGSLEGQHFRKTGKLVSLSEQNLIDCSKRYGNNGCEGGLMDNAFTYIKANDGIDTEGSYLYEAKEGTCRYDSKDKGADDKGFIDIPPGDEESLKNAVATIGPISIAIDASSMSFQLYRSGVYIDDECSSKSLDHGVLLVGYGTEDGQDYWLVKNSWGSSWGEMGYIKMARNRENQCGVASMASYPIV